MKTCRKCQEEKPLESFNKDSKRPDRLHFYCKVCQAEYGRARREARKAAQQIVVESKQCPRCKEVKMRDEYYLDSGNLSGLASICKRCNRSKKLLDLYGIDADEYDTIYSEQDGKCKICNKICQSGKQLAVDHCHATGKVRGLLCIRCNNALGALDDNVEVMKKMIDYVMVAKN